MTAADAQNHRDSPNGALAKAHGIAPAAPR